MQVPELLLRTRGADATRAVAAALAAHLRPGDVVALTGELGAGKTCFVQGAATGLDVSVPVTSPTFVLVRTYPGRIPVVHCDVYRLDRLGDVLELGDEVLAPDVVTFVEWGDAIATLLPPDHLEVELTSLVAAPGGQRSDQGSVEARGGGASDPDGGAAVEDAVPERRIAVRLHGLTAARHDLLADALATWQEPA